MNRLSTLLGRSGGSNRQEIARIQMAVVAHYRLASIWDLRGHCRVRTFCHPRQVAMYLCYEDTPAVFEEIGLHFANRDHRSIMHACGVIERELETKGCQTEDDVEAIRSKLRILKPEVRIQNPEAGKELCSR